VVVCIAMAQGMR